MEKTKLLVLEDQTLIRLDLVDRIRAYFDFEIIEASNSADAMATQPDLAICDIDLEGDEASGIDVAYSLNESRQVPIIFVTKIQDDTQVFDRVNSASFPKFYMSKPISNNGLKIAIGNAMQHLGQAANTRHEDDTDQIELLSDRMFIRNGRGKVAIEVEKMLWWQSGGGESSMVITQDRVGIDGPHPTVGYNLSKLEERLAFYPHFVRCSRYHIVNLQHVSRILDLPGGKSGSKKALLVADTEIPVGEKYRKEVMRRLHIL